MALFKTPFRGIRKLIGGGLILGMIALWFFPSDIVELIIRQRPIVLGLYSQGHFSALILISLIVLILSSLLLSKQPLGKKMLINVSMTVFSIVLSLFFIVWANKLLVAPRYVEKQTSDVVAEAPKAFTKAKTEASTPETIKKSSVEQDKVVGSQSQQLTVSKKEIARLAQQLRLQGVVRHRSPNQHFDFTYIDKPKQARSYPNAPKGHDDVAITLSTDANGYRNASLAKQYDVLVVGDSFAAGSHVTDEQIWTRLLADQTGLSIYNMGVSGADLQEYINNFVLIGLSLAPKTLVVMVYEGNDFRETSLPSHRKDWRPNNGAAINVETINEAAANAASAKSAAIVKATVAASTVSDSPVKVSPAVVKPAEKEKQAEQSSETFAQWLKSSPIIAGLRRLSSQYLETINADAPVVGYDELVGWMPVGFITDSGSQYYSFKPKRAVYLNVSEQAFSQSDNWLGTAAVLTDMKAVSDRYGIEMIVVYAPSKPHVVMPLVKEVVSPEQLHHFLSYKAKRLPKPAQTAESFYRNLDSQESVLTQFCLEQDIAFLSTTENLQQATKAGVHTYFTYNQHWTPEGNKVVANTVGEFLKRAKATDSDDAEGQ